MTVEVGTFYSVGMADAETTRQRVDKALDEALGTTWVGFLARSERFAIQPSADEDLWHHTAAVIEALVAQVRGLADEIDALKRSI